MNVPVCVKCKKRPASVFITRLDDGKQVNEGFCFVCANEMGLKPFNYMF